jgi:hypothetical protein
VSILLNKHTRRGYDHERTLSQQFFGVACQRSKRGCQKKNKKQKTKGKNESTTRRNPNSKRSQHQLRLSVKPFGGTAIGNHM